MAAGGHGSTMNQRDPPAAGDSYTYQRTFTPADVRSFAEVSGDR